MNMVSKRALMRIRTSISQITDAFSPSEENVQSILNWIMPDLDPDELKKALQYYYAYLSSARDDGNGGTVYDERLKPYFDPLPGLFSKYTIIQKHMKLTIKMGRNWWPYIQDYIKNPNYVLEMVGRKSPAIKRMLSTELGGSFVRYYTDRLYTFFSLYFWKFPRYHNNCGGLILYGLVNRNANAWGFFCRKCKTPISVDDLDALTYQKRIYPESDIQKDGKPENA